MCQVAVWAITAGLLLACVLLARLLYAPINLDFARDVIQSQTNSFLPGWDMSYEAAEVGWNWRSVKPWVTIDHIQLVDRRDRLVADVPQVRVDVSFTGLFGAAGVSTIVVDRASVKIIDLAAFSDSTQGSIFDDLFKWDDAPRPEIFKPVTEAFSRFTARLVRQAPRLENITFVNTKVDINRGETRPELSIGMPFFRLNQVDDRLSVAAQVDASIAGEQTRLRLAGEAEPDIGELSLDVAFSDLSLNALAQEFALPAYFTYLNVPLGLDVSLDLSAETGLRGARFEATLGEGYLFDSLVFPVKSPVNFGVVSGALDIAESQITIDEVSVLLGDNAVSGSGLVYWEEGEKQAGARLGLELKATTVDEIKKYWPIPTHPDGRPRGARAWVGDHMLGGIAENVRFDVSINPDGTTPYLNNSPFKLTFNFREIDTYYVKTMPPLENVTGRGVYTRTAFDVFVNSGVVAGMPVGGSTANMTDIHVKGKAYGVFNVELEGEVREVLDLVDRKPVRIGERIKMDLDRLAGKANIAARLSLPLLKNPPKESVLYEVKAFVKTGSVDQLLGGEGLRTADVSLELNGDTLTASGFGDVNGVPMELYWQEDFKKGRSNPLADTSFLVMSGVADEHDIKALGVDISEYLNGKARAEATFLGRNLKFRVGYFSADATEAKLKVSPLAWEKAHFVPATVTGTLHLLDQGTKLDSLVVKGEDVDLFATFMFDGPGEYSGTVDAKKLGNNEANATIKKTLDTPLSVTVSAEVFDLAPLIAKPLVAEKTEKLQSSTKSTSTVDFDLSLEAETLLLQNGESLSSAELALKFHDNEPSLLNFKANDRSGETRVSITPSDTVLRPFTASTNVGGGLLRGLGLFAHMNAGKLVLNGETGGWSKDLTLKGVLRVDDTSLIAKSTLKETITEGVISGLDDYLEGGSIGLDVINMPFTYEGELLDISGLKANGPSLGMTMEGQIHTGENKVNVNGVVVPAYGLNSLLGKIPLLGALFSGGDGKGLFGVTYRVKGTTNEPKVTVNPLSGLAPGFLRLIFEGGKGKVSDVEIPDNEDKLGTETQRDEISTDAIPTSPETIEGKAKTEVTQP